MLITFIFFLQLRQEFLALDADGDGDISVKEMETLLKTLKRQLKMSDREIGKLIKDVDQNGDGKVDVKEFFNLIECGKKRDVIHKELVKRSGIRQSFQKYDTTILKKKNFQLISYLKLFSLHYEKDFTNLQKQWMVFQLPSPDLQVKKIRKLLVKSFTKL